jgi:hypothetical protein
VQVRDSAWPLVQAAREGVLVRVQSGAAAPAGHLIVPRSWGADIETSARAATHNWYSSIAAVERAVGTIGFTR